jgi:hypothetical protein
VLSRPARVNHEPVLRLGRGRELDPELRTPAARCDGVLRRAGDVGNAVREIERVGPLDGVERLDEPAAEALDPTRRDRW